MEEELSKDRSQKGDHGTYPRANGRKGSKDGEQATQGQGEIALEVTEFVDGP